MIVNTAYIYMGSAGGPVNPVIFQQNEINYNYSGTNFNVTSDGYLKMLGKSELVFTGLDLSNFEKLTVRGRNYSQSKVSLIVNFIDDSGNVSANISKRFESGSITNGQYTIPLEYRKPKTKIKMSIAGVNGLELQSAILS